MENRIMSKRQAFYFGWAMFYSGCMAGAVAVMGAFVLLGVLTFAVR